MEYGRGEKYGVVSVVSPAELCGLWCCMIMTLPGHSWEGGDGGNVEQRHTHRPDIWAGVQVHSVEGRITWPQIDNSCGADSSPETWDHYWAKISRRLWTCLCGNTLFFFNNAKDTHYVEKMDLSGFVSLKDDCSRDRNLEAARLILRMKDGETKLTVANLEARELWKGFLQSVVDLSVPSCLTLLPGQVQMLREVVDRERNRRRAARTPTRAPPSPLSVPLLGEIPSCFRPVSRTEAEVLLERHPDCGNMLLRPGRDGSSLAVTTRQDLNGSVFRHYRVTQREQGGYVIDVENPIPCATLHDVIDALVEKTAGTLQPFLLEEPYEENITFVSSNEENGERILHCAPSSPLPKAPALPPKQERWKPLPRSPAPDRRILSAVTSPVPSSPSSPMRRLVLSPSPLLAQSLTEELKMKLEKRRTSQD
ncbi:signal-transducing adaptor protein 1-like isoform X1 [Oncorhynchus tshawytscha]|uniref:SH2 domain-containing protein n=2 Tax=Oncorhynchus TaxID=8016 RepID=A0A8C8K4W0_ONCTS|nr:signal-transducing adaptor protein 1-like isoform X1 [Oncorhynchus tshawytscha]